MSFISKALPLPGAWLALRAFGRWTNSFFVASISQNLLGTIRDLLIYSLNLTDHLTFIHSTQQIGLFLIVIQLPVPSSPIIPSLEPTSLSTQSGNCTQQHPSRGIAETSHGQQQCRGDIHLSRNSDGRNWRKIDEPMAIYGDWAVDEIQYPICKQES